MTSEAEVSTDAVLSDAERLQQLEKSSKLNRLIIYALAGTVLVIVLVTVIVQAVTLMSSPPVDKTVEQMDGFKQQLHSVQGEVAELKQQLQLQETQLAQVAQQQKGNLAGILKPVQDPGTAQQLAKTLLGQEADFQQVVLTLQVGMRDLAYMLPGSRTWLEYYTEALNKSVATSKVRSVEIQQWAKGQAPVAVVPMVAPTPDSPAPAGAAKH